MSTVATPLRKNDSVLVITGKDRGKKGRVLKVLPEKNRLIVEGVKKEFKVDSVVIKRKPTSSRPATDQVLDDLAKEADLVISAMAD